MKTHISTLADGRTVDYLPEVIGEGSMKQVYWSADHLSVLCFYKDLTKSADRHRLARLEAIVGK